MTSSKRKQLITRYLLGHASERERAVLEEEYFFQETSLAEVLATENDLIDAYARETLSSREASHFRNRYLRNAKRREKVEFAAALAQYDRHVAGRSTISRAQQSPSSFQDMPGFPAIGIPRSRIVAGALALLLFLAVLRITINKQHDYGQSQRQQSAISQPPEQGTRANSGFSPELQKNAQPKDAVRTVASLILSPHHTRGSKDKTSLLNLSSAISTVAITLNLDNGKYIHYAVVLEQVEGRLIWESHSLNGQWDGQHLPMVSFQVPAKLLRNGDYVIKLSGISLTGDPDDLGGYAFAVRH